jgi:hypothetical protein
MLRLISIHRNVNQGIEHDTENLFGVMNSERWINNLHCIRALLVLKMQTLA